MNFAERRIKSLESEIECLKKTPSEIKNETHSTDPIF